MLDAIRYEVVRLRTIRSTFWLVALSLVPSAAVAGLIAAQVDPDGLLGEAAAVVILTGGTQFAPLPLTAVFMALFGVLAIGHEYRHGTIRPSLAVVPDRSVLLAAKVLTTTVVSALVGGVSVLLNAAVAYAVGWRWTGVEPETWGALIGFVLLVVLWTLLGLGAASVVRNLAAVVVLMFVVPLVVEPVLTFLTLFVEPLQQLQPATRYLPFGAGAQLTQTSDTAAVFAVVGSGISQLSPVAGGSTFAALALVVLALGWVLLERRDA